MSSEPTDDTVIDLTRAEADAAKVSVKIDRHANPFDEMSEQQRMRLFIRVLCELVAYGELDEADATKVA